jgi:hypothetical protein
MRTSMPLSPLFERRREEETHRCRSRRIQAAAAVHHGSPLRSRRKKRER